MLLIAYKYKFTAFAVVIFVSIAGLIGLKTPYSIPDGFPYSAKTLKSEQFIKKEKQINANFVDRTLEKGIHFIHQQGDEKLAGIDESLGSGVCAADFNNDGWTDLFLVNGSGHTHYYGKQYWWQSSQGNKLYLNDKGRYFLDATAASGLEIRIWGMGCLAADFDNDGHTDLLVTGKHVKLLYKNDGKGKFIDVTQKSGLSGDFWSTSASAADINGDGLLDIYIGNFVDFEKGKKTFEANSRFAGEKKYTFDASLYQAQPNQLYLNTGGLTFKEIAAQAGVNDLDGRAMDVSWQDVNNDRRPDLLVTNDRGTGSTTSYINTDGEHFKPGEQGLGLRSALGNRGMSSGDLDNDGDIDLVVASPNGESTVALIKEQTTDGNSRYKDRAREMGIGANQFLSLSAWSPIVQDFNNDGLNDLFVAAGHLEPDPDAAKISQGQPKQLLLNKGHGFFEDVTSSVGIALQDKQSARGAAAADFDNDGDVDLYIAHNNDLGQYLVNESAQKHWLGLKLEGSQSNRDAIGATVELVTPKLKQLRSLVSGEGFLSDSDKRIIFGLGDETEVTQLIINWPSGNIQKIQVPEVDKYWLVKENSEILGELPIALPAKADPRLRLKLGSEQAEIRARYVRMLSQLGIDDTNMSELMLAYTDNDPLVRREVIAVASRANSAQGLSLLVLALDDKNPANVIAAIEGLREYEDETSVRWLLRLFFHKDPAVKIALANCFAFFFDEEEAVVHRKYLALPHLIRMLDDTEAQVRIAAARALANAERFRGVNALLEHLSDSDPTVRAEIVRTLGLIRQGQASTHLVQLLTDETQPAQVLANVFIALKRLGDAAAAKKLEFYVSGQNGFEKIALEKRLDVFAELLSQASDAAVFDFEKLKSIVLSEFKKSPPKENNSIKRWIVIQKYIKSESSVNWLETQTHSSHPEIRALAFQALFSQAYGEAISLLHRAWHDKDSSISLWALKGLLKKNAGLSTDDYRRIVENTDFRSKALEIWAEVGFSADPAQLIQVLYSDNKTETVVNSTHKSPALENICFSTNHEIQVFCPIILFAGNQPEYINVAVNLLSDPSQSLDVRQSILVRYGVDFDSEAAGTLYTITQDKKDPLRGTVIQKLLTFDTDALIGFAWKLANNPAESNEIRFQAIQFLVKKNQPEALEILYR